jgi:hypothetical protein
VSDECNVVGANEEEKEAEEEEDMEDEDEEEGQERTLTHTSSFSDRPRSHSHISNESPSNTPIHPTSFSRLLSKRLEVFIHWVLQVPTFRHIIDPFVKNFRNKILEWELDRYQAVYLPVYDF